MQMGFSMYDIFDCTPPLPPNGHTHLRLIMVQSTAGFSKRLYTFKEALAWSIQITRAMRKLHTHSPCIIHRGGWGGG